jgi:hypothetical protein
LRSPGGYGGSGGVPPPPPPPAPKKSNIGCVEHLSLLARALPLTLNLFLPLSRPFSLFVAPFPRSFSPLAHSFIVGGAALVAGAATYYLTQEPAGTATNDLHRIEAAAKSEFDHLRAGARSTSEPLVPGSTLVVGGRGVANLDQPETRYGASQVGNSLARDAEHVKQDVSSWASGLKSDAKREGHEIKQEAKAWGERLETKAEKEKKAFKPFTNEIKVRLSSPPLPIPPHTHSLTSSSQAWGEALRSGPNEAVAWKGFTDEIHRARQALRSNDVRVVEQVEGYLSSKGTVSHNLPTVGGNPWCVLPFISLSLPFPRLELWLFRRPSTRAQAHSLLFHLGSTGSVAVVSPFVVKLLSAT